MKKNLYLDNEEINLTLQLLGEVSVKFKDKPTWNKLLNFEKKLLEAIKHRGKT